MGIVSGETYHLSVRDPCLYRFVRVVIHLSNFPHHLGVREVWSQLP